VQTRLFHTQNFSISADWPKGDSRRLSPRAATNGCADILPTPSAQRALPLVGILATVVAEAPMARVEKISVALPPEMVGAVRDAVVSGEYASTSEVIRDALRDWTLKRKVATIELDEMRRLVREGIESGPGVDADLVFARLRAKYAGATEE
jgi:antitoxin ParD1/3/4